MLHDLKKVEMTSTCRPAQQKKEMILQLHARVWRRVWCLSVYDDKIILQLGNLWKTNQILCMTHDIKINWHYFLIDCLNVQYTEKERGNRFCAYLSSTYSILYILFIFTFYFIMCVSEFLWNFSTTNDGNESRYLLVRESTVIFLNDSPQQIICYCLQLS
jgi:hypothetical protein